MELRLKRLGQQGCNREGMETVLPAPMDREHGNERDPERNRPAAATGGGAGAAEQAGQPIRIQARIIAVR